MSGGCNSDYEANKDGAQGDEDEGCAADFGAVAVVGRGDCEAGSGDVNGYSEELGRGGDVAEFVDDCWEEEGDAVQGTDYSPVHLKSHKLASFSAS